MRRRLLSLENAFEITVQTGRIDSLGACSECLGCRFVGSIRVVRRRPLVMRLRGPRVVRVVTLSATL